MTKHCLDQALTEHSLLVDLHVSIWHCLDQALTKHSPFVDLHVLTIHCLDQTLTKHSLITGQALTKH